MVARLATQEITEPSEELRLSLVSLLSSLVRLGASRVAPYLQDLVSILQKTIVDPYPEVKKVSRLTVFVAIHVQLHMWLVSLMESHNVYHVLQSFFDDLANGSFWLHIFGGEYDYRCTCCITLSP